MTRSMTGFGKATTELDGQAVTVELCAVNHRYLDASLRTPSAWSALEPDIKQELRKHLARGKINVTLSRKRSTGTGPNVRLDPEVALQYVEASREMAQMLGSYETLSVNALSQLEGVFIQEEPEEDLEALRAGLLTTVTRALEQLNAMREAEGAALASDIRMRIDLIRKALAAVEGRLPELNAHYEERLRARIDELAADMSITEERIGIEVALLAEKADVTEEVVRLKTHLEHMAELLESSEPVGRRLDFLSQEIQREVNTLGVKTRDSDVAKDVLEMKAELEKIREQVQNIE